MLRDNPKARQVLYIVAFVSASLALFAPMIPGSFGAQLAVAFTSLSALATAAATTTALNNLNSAPPPPPYEPVRLIEPEPWPGINSETAEQFVSDLKGAPATHRAGTE